MSYSLSVHETEGIIASNVNDLMEAIGVPQIAESSRKNAEMAQQSQSEMIRANKEKDTAIKEKSSLEKDKHDTDLKNQRLVMENNRLKTENKYNIDECKKAQALLLDEKKKTAKLTQENAVLINKNKRKLIHDEGYHRKMENLKGQDLFDEATRQGISYSEKPTQTYLRKKLYAHHVDRNTYA